MNLAIKTQLGVQRLSNEKNKQITLSKFADGPVQLARFSQAQDFIGIFVVAVVIEVILHQLEQSWKVVLVRQMSQFNRVVLQMFHAIDREVAN